MVFPPTVTLGVFGKHWTPGLTKTRLAASVGAAAAAELSRHFLEATLVRLASIASDGPRRLAFAPAKQSEDFARLDAVRSGDWRLEPQSEGDLGRRMAAFFRDHSPAILMGTDSPNVPLAAVRQAAAWLEARQGRPGAVFGPSDDGGYWLIGVSGQPHPALFNDLPWSSADLLQTTFARLETAGWRRGHDYEVVAGWYDVDDLAGLRRLRGDCTADLPMSELAAAIDRLVPPALLSL